MRSLARQACLTLLWDGVVAGDRLGLAPSLPSLGGRDGVAAEGVGARERIVQDVNAGGLARDVDMNAAASVVLDYGVRQRMTERPQASRTEKRMTTDVIDGSSRHLLPAGVGAAEARADPTARATQADHRGCTARDCPCRRVRRGDARNAGIGDNQPPEAVELPSPEEIVSDALAGADAVLVENSFHPRRRAAPAQDVARP